MQTLFAVHPGVHMFPCTLFRDSFRFCDSTSRARLAHGLDMFDLGSGNRFAALVKGFKGDSFSLPNTVCDVRRSLLKTVVSLGLCCPKQLFQGDQLLL